MAPPDAGQVEQREEQPATQQPAAHGSGSDVQGIEQGARSLALEHGLDEFQVAARLLVNDQEFVAPKEIEAGHGQRGRDLGGAHVAQDSTGGQAGLRGASERVPFQSRSEPVGQGIEGRGLAVDADRGLRQARVGAPDEGR